MEGAPNGANFFRATVPRGGPGQKLFGILDFDESSGARRDIGALAGPVMLWGPGDGGLKRAACRSCDHEIGER